MKCNTLKDFIDFMENPENLGKECVIGDLNAYREYIEYNAKNKQESSKDEKATAT